MSDGDGYDPVSCPVEDCAYHDTIRSVAAHVSGSDDEAHDWAALGYDRAVAFVKDEKRRQQAGASRADWQADDDASPAESGADELLDGAFLRDAVAAAALAREYDAESLDELDPFRLSNLYALLSNVKSTSDSARKAVRDALLEEVQDDREITSDIGAVRRSSYERTSLRDESTVRDALDRAGVEPESAMSFDRGKLEDIVEASALNPDDVFETEERTRIQRTGIDESAVDSTLGDVDVEGLLEG